MTFAKILFFLNKHDGAQIMRLARAVRLFKDMRHQTAEAADRERASLLFLKSIMEQDGETFTIREIAKLVGQKDAVSEDGFSALRRKCKQLGIPVKASRKTSRK